MSKGSSGAASATPIRGTAADEQFALSVLPKREPGTHKWAVGGLVIVAGGPTYIGAAALAASAAARAGAGIVSLAVPRGAMGAIATLVPEVVFVPLGEGEPDIAARRGAETIGERFQRSTAMLVGPGLGTDEHAEALLAALFGGANAVRTASVGFRAGPAATHDEPPSPVIAAGKPIVLDADALNWLSTRPGWWTELAGARLVLTPHVGEFARLTGFQPAQITAAPVDAAVEFARKIGQVVVLKGAPTVASDGKRALVAEDAPESLAKAGTGDVFSGTIAAFLAQGLEPLEAAGLAMHVGCRAARLVEERTGTLGLVASDLPLSIAATLKALESVRGNDRG